MAKQKLEAQLGLNTKEFQSKLKQAQQSMEGFRSGLMRIQQGFMALAAGTGAWTLVKKAIDSTNATGDIFDRTMQKIDNSTSMFFRTITSGALYDLWGNLERAAEAGEKYWRVMDEISDMQRSLNTAFGDARIKMSDLEEVFRDRTGRHTFEQKEKALEEYRKTYEGLQVMQVAIDKETLDATKENISALSGLRDDEIEMFIKGYYQQRKMIKDVVIPAMDEYAEKQAEISALGNKAYGVNQRTGETFVKNKNALALLNVATSERDSILTKLSPKELQWYKLLERSGRLSKEEEDVLEKLYMGASKSAADLNSVRLETLRIEAMISNERKAALELLKKENEFTGKRITIRPNGVDTSTLGQMQTPFTGEQVIPGLEQTIGLVEELDSAFQNLFANTGRGLKGMADAFKDALAQMVAQLAAKAAVFGILTLLSGGAGGLGKAATKILDGKGMLQFMGVPQFGGSAPVGAGAGMKLNVEGIVKGGNIHISNRHYGKLLGRNT